MVRHSEEMSSDADKSQLKGASLTFMGANSMPKVREPVSLSHESSANNCHFDSNWNFALSFITRLPQYLDGEDSDIFILSGSDDLAPELHEVLIHGEQE